MQEIPESMFTMYWKLTNKGYLSYVVIKDPHRWRCSNKTNVQHGRYHL